MTYFMGPNCPSKYWTWIGILKPAEPHSPREACYVPLVRYRMWCDENSLIKSKANYYLILRLYIFPNFYIKLVETLARDDHITWKWRVLISVSSCHLQTTCSQVVRHMSAAFQLLLAEFQQQEVSSDIFSANLQTNHTNPLPAMKNSSCNSATTTAIQRPFHSDSEFLPEVEEGQWISNLLDTELTWSMNESHLNFVRC